MLLALDAAIGHLVTVRTLLLAGVPDDVIPEVAEPGPHDGHLILPGGFGEGLQCVDCGMDLGVSSDDSETPEP